MGGGDVELLLRRFLDEFDRRGPRHVTRVAPDAMRALLDHAWPGNVRELRNVVEYAFAVGRGPELRLDELPPEFLEERSAPRATAPPATPTPARGEGDATRIRRALAETGGDINAAAAQVGMSRATFWRKRRKYGI